MVHEALIPLVGQIVATLNARGHKLRYYEEPVPGTLVFRDDTGAGPAYHCDLRLAVDTVISVGFRDTVDAIDVE